MKGLVKCFKLQQTRSSTRITSNDRHNTCHAKLSKCCGKLYPSSAVHPSSCCCCLLPAALGQAMYWRMPLTGFSINYTFIEWACEEAIPGFSHSTNGRTGGWMDGQMEGWKKGKRDSCRDQRRRTLHAAAELKSDNRFYSIFPRCRKRFKNFSPPAKQKSKKKILETFNAVAAASSSAAGFLFPCLAFFSTFPCPYTLFLALTNVFFFLLLLGCFLPTRDVQKLNGNQHITSGKICVNKVAGVVAHRRESPLPRPHK